MWQVYDFMEGRDGNERFPKARGGPIYGPLPCKRWVPDGKHHKRNYKPRTKLSDAPKCDQRTVKAYTAAKAVEYAMWLARRDGVVIPSGAYGVPVWSEVAVPGKKKPEPRAMAVEWLEQKRTRHWSKQRGEWYETATVAVITPIPQWDFVPSEPIETLLDS